jgi:uncharacterized protein YutE (UPF0331/DUF86 family)
MNDRPKRLPREIAVRLKDFRPHYEALSVALLETTAEQFVAAANKRTPDELNRRVYPIERSFEILCNYVAELNELGLEAAGVTAGATRRANLRLLARDGVISLALERTLAAVLSARNDLAHEYPDVRATGIYGATEDLAAAAPDYAAAYVAWMRRLGFGGD